MTRTSCISQASWLSEEDKVAVEEKLCQRRVIDPQTGCWMWTGGMGRGGYGRIQIRWRFYTVSRLSAWLYLGMNLKDITICACHKCDNPPCFNPNHLFLGTNKENKDDSIRKGRAKWVYGEENFKAKLNRFQVQRIHLFCRLGMGQRAIANLFRVSQSNVSRISRGKKWKHLSINGQDHEIGCASTKNL